MNVNFTKKASVFIVSITGEMDHHVTDETRKMIDENFLASGCRNIVFDFKGITFMDSSGIGMIIGRYKEANALGGSVGVANVSEQADRIFMLSGIYRIVRKFDNVDDAVKYA